MNASDIAKLAGVSRSTVSRVVNNYANVPPETRDKVMRVIEAYNYVPNMSAQVMAGKKTKTLGLFIISHGPVAGDFVSNMLITSVIEQASHQGYYVLTYIVGDPSTDQAAVKKVNDMFYQGRVDGGLFIGAAYGEPFIESLIAEGYQAAIIDQDLNGNHAEDKRIVAEYDNHKGMRLAIDCLAELGHRKIGVIKGDMSRLSGVTKFEGFQAAMQLHGLPVVQDWVLPADFSEQGGKDAIIRLLEQQVPLPTAIIAANDSVAFGAITALQGAGLKVPEDVSVIGFDNHVLSAYHNPPLTTVAVDFEGLMKTVTASLIRHIESNELGSERIVIDYALIERQSCRDLKQP
ncbi:LacI family transcriptional regulator [Paenibacillus phyllosphaerae]|uniref:LacI family transcriptional regulator n=1 Tax=Paenibacillus phyllosphaerae TaxID=274593 RepID=A0A7W5B515_9BACL|nr:LacI family DNA-binding transcriptional regulator [Paenibacillus phyllosphaerae]MBB3114532.1 LacI family transcriptional regulator [Paenibacillus phyllosphaerae]